MKTKLRRKASQRQSLRRALKLESLESRQLMAGDIAGTVYEDLNQNGSRDGGENGVSAGWRVFVDNNLDGSFTAGEPSAQTNNDGDYLIRGVSAGLRRVSVELPLGWTPTKPASQDVTVINNTEVTADFFAFAGGTIAGVVWNDANDNGVRDIDPGSGQFIDEGLAGWTVYLDLNTNELLDADEPKTLTDAAGNYEFTDVPPGDYEVTEELPVGWEPAKGYDWKQTAAVSPLTTFVQDFANFSLVNGSIEGTVWNDVDGNGDREKDPTTGLPTEPGLAGWTIFVDLNLNESLDSGEPSTVTDADGDYQFVSLLEGSYSVVEIAPSSSWSLAPGFTNPQTVSVFAGERTKKVDFANFTIVNGAIAGTVWNDLNRDGIRNTDLSGVFLEPGLSDWTIALDMNRNGTFDSGEPNVLTDANGQYLFDDLQIGEYEIIEIVPTGWETAPGFDDNQTVRVYSGATSIAPDFANFNISTLVAGSVAGIVWNDSNGNGVQETTEAGIQGWSVFADLDFSGTYSAGEPQATTGTDGSYLVSGVNPGTVTIRVAIGAGWHATAPLSASQTLTLKNGENATGIDFGSQPTYDSAVSGVAFVDSNKNGVRDVGERGLSGITIFVDLNRNGLLETGEPNQLSSTDQFYTPSVDEAGTFSFTHLAAGTYQVRQILPATLSATPSSELMKEVTLSAGLSTLPIGFADVYRSNEIRGSLFDDANQNSIRDAGELPLGGKRVYIDLDRDNQRDATEPETTTDGDGKYAFVGITPGIYVVREELEPGHTSSHPDTRGGILWPSGTSNAAIGNVTPNSVTVSLTENESLRQNYSITLPGSGGLANMVDVFLLFDDTGSFVNNSPIVRGAFPTIMSQLQASLPGIDLGFGVGRFEEYANFAYEYSSGRPFVLNQPIVASSTVGYQSAIQAALNRTTPGYGGDEPETDIEALYQLVTGLGFDGNNNGTTSESGAAGLATTQLNPGASGDVPSFASFTADPAQGVLASDGSIGGGGFRAGALPVVLLATDTGFAFQPKGETSITGLGGVSVPVSNLSGTSRPTTPHDLGAGLQETVTALNALGALVIGLGTNTESNIDPRQALESLSRLTGATNQTTTTIANGTTDPIAPGDPFYFEIASGFASSVSNGVINAIQNAVTNVAMNITVRASDPRIRIVNHTGTLTGIKAGQTANFDIEIIGDGAPHRFDLQFVREGTDVILGSIPVVIGTPIPGDCYHFEDLEEGEIEDSADFGEYSSSASADINDPPVFLVGPSQVVAEDAGSQNVVGWATNISPGPSSESWQTVNFMVTTDRPDLFSVQPTVSAEGTLSYQPAANAFGLAIVTVVLHDNGGTAEGGVDTSAPQQFTIAINSVNDAPVALDDAYATVEDITLSIASPGALANDNDIDGDSLSVRVLSGPVHGVLSLSAAGLFSYTPDSNYVGSDSFTYIASDGVLDSAPATVVIVVSAANDAPQASDDSYSATEDTVLEIPAPGVLGNDSDSDGDSLTAVLVSGPTKGTLVLNADGSFSYTPSANFNGSDSFSYYATDGSAGSNVATVTIQVLPTNDAPVSIDDAYATVEDTVLSIASPGVLANDNEIDGDSLSARVLSGPVHGVLSLSAAGLFSYTPDSNYVGSDSFTYIASDGVLDSAPATVIIVVSAANDAPLASDDSYSATEDTVLEIPAPGVLGNDSDSDGDSLTAVLVSGPTKGTLVLNADGSFSYTPSANFNGSDSFSYYATDGSAGSNVATVTIQVLPTNDAPVAEADGYATTAGATLSVSLPGVLVNDGDIDADELSAVLLTPPTSGNVTLNSNGSFSYVPNPGFSGTDSFTYQASDGTTNSNSALVTITVAPIAGSKSDYLVVDQSRRRLYEYNDAGSSVGNYRLNKDDETPMGLATNSDGKLRWVVDAKGEVFVYDLNNNLIGNWEVKDIDRPEGITVSGNDLWIVDRASVPKVAYFAGGALHRRGKVSATSTFRLDRSNQSPTDLVTDGSTIWVVNDGSKTDTVFVYSTSGSSLGAWTIDSRNNRPTGLTIDPNSNGNILIVDSRSDKIYQYDSSTLLRTGTQPASRSLSLDSTNGNPQGIAITPGASSGGMTIASRQSMAAGGSPLASSINVRDVNEDGHESAVDALLVMNYLNSDASSKALASPWLLDVSNDGQISPSDALNVINALNSRIESEGEFSQQDLALLNVMSEGEQLVELLASRTKRLRKL